MGFVTRFCRCIPGFSILAWILLAYLALGDRIPSPWSSKPNIPPSQGAGNFYTLTITQILYITYSVLAHLLACLGFPLRLIWAVWHMTGEITTANFEAAEGRLYAESEYSDELSSQKSGSVKGLGTPEGPQSRASTPKIPGFPDTPLEPVIHAIILPSYKEDIDTLRETLSVLASHVLAKPTYDVSFN
jgi:hypothetical protein